MYFLKPFVTTSFTVPGIPRNALFSNTSNPLYFLRVRNSLMSTYKAIDKLYSLRHLNFMFTVFISLIK
jgi:hypothetical protein